jgi:hypothetical protein
VETEEFDPFQGSNRLPVKHSSNTELDSKVQMLNARQDAFRSIADRFYMIWWNLPSTPIHQVDQEIRDLFRKYMELAPSLGVSRNGIPELKECCGRKRDPFPGDVTVDLSRSISGRQEMAGVKDGPPPDERLGFCPGDLIRRVTRFLGFKFCRECDGRRRKINAFFRCGDGK